MSQQLLRSILPSWTFFSDTGLNPKLFVCEGQDKSQLSGEKCFYSPSPRRFWQILFNPSINLKIRERAILFHLILESQKLSSEQLLKSSTFLSVKFLVNQSCQQNYYQFRLYNQLHDDKPELVIESPVFMKENHG